MRPPEEPISTGPTKRRRPKGRYLVLSRNRGILSIPEGPHLARLDLDNGPWEAWRIHGRYRTAAVRDEALKNFRRKYPYVQFKASMAEEG